MASIKADLAINPVVKKLAADSKIPISAFKALIFVIDNFALLLKCVLYIYHLVQFKND